MKNQGREVKVAAMGLDVHYKFSTVTMRDEQGRVVARERLEHTDLAALRGRLAQWPKGVPAVVEASFGWGWLSDELTAAFHELGVARLGGPCPRHRPNPAQNCARKRVGWRRQGLPRPGVAVRFDKRHRA